MPFFVTVHVRDKSHSKSKLHVVFHCGYCLLLEVRNELLTGVSTIIDGYTFCVCVCATVLGNLTGRIEK